MVGLSGHGYTEGGLSLLPLRMTSHLYTGDVPIIVQTCGNANNSQQLTKVMLLLGNSPERLETFKDALVNYLFQVKAQDTRRLVLVSSCVFIDDPPAVKVYVFYQEEGDVLPFNLVVVDVPPLGKMGSTQRDVELLRGIEQFLMHQFGTSQVDGITLVAPSPEETLHAFIDIFHLLALCFQDVANLIQLVVTDSNFYVTLIASLKEYDLKYRGAFVFDGDETTNTDAISPEEYFFSQIYHHFDFHGIDDFFYEMQDIPLQRMVLMDKVDKGGLDIGDLVRMRVVRQCTEVVGVTNFTFSLCQFLFEVRHRDEAARTQHLILGEPNNKASKVLLLIGDKSSGKTTILTSLVNHLFGVKYHDRFRFLVDGDPLFRLDKNHTSHKTRFTTAYTFTTIPEPYNNNSLTIIDTPGFRSPEEHSHNKQVATRVAALQATCDIQHLDMIGLVAEADTGKLPDTYRSVTKHITSLLTTMERDRLLLLATRSDAKRPVVRGELRRFSLPITRTLRFNTHSILADPLDRDEDDITHNTLTELYWKMEENSLQLLLDDLFI